LTHTLFGGWRTAGIVIVQSGAPFPVNLSTAAGEEIARIGLVNGNKIERPDLAGDPNSGSERSLEDLEEALTATNCPCRRC
jgi:hypothetical protein